MKILIIDTDNVGLSFAWRCAQAGHSVEWFVKPKPCNNPDTGIGFKGVKKIQNWVPSVMKSDLVFCTSNDDYLPRLDFFKKKGARIFAPSQQSANLEISRQAGMKIMEEAGIEVAPYKVFKNMKEARKHVEKTEERFVFKTLGDNEDKALTYVSKHAADMLQWIDKMIELKSEPKGDVMLQTFIKGIEMGVSRWMGKNGWVGQWNESFEHKKLMSGNYGPNCYSDDTEVLTVDGWKFWPDVTENDEICTLNDGMVKFETPSQVVVGDFDGEMIGWQSPFVDILVTPGHNMYVQDDHDRKDFWFEPAIETVSKNRNILRGSGVWNGQDNPELLPSFYKGGFGEWCALIGAYIADGNTKPRSLQFGNCPEHKQTAFIEIAERAGFTAKMYGNDLYINSTQLAAYCKNFGLATNKYVPDYIKTASISSIKSFLYGYGIGDASNRPGNLVYTTVSKRLSDDLQELCLKVGCCANIVERDRRGESHFINGYECINKSISYDIGVSCQRLKAGLSPEISYRKSYNGKVYCCTVTSHIIYVRRNGKACWLGQTGEMGTIAANSQDSKLGKETLAKFEEPLKKLGHLGDTAIGFIIEEKTGKPYPTEWTMRPGWPIFNMMLGAMKGDPAEWMSDALDGKDTTNFSEDIGCCLVMAHKDFPHDIATHKETSGIPIYGVTKGNKKHLHPQGVKIDIMPDMDGDKIVHRPLWNTAGTYSVIITGYGDSVEQSTERAYGTAKQLHISNGILRDDIGEELEHQLPELHKLGYATHFNYAKENKK